MAITTVDVAKQLEEKYHIVDTFYEIEQDKISDLIEEAFGEEIEKVMTMRRFYRGMKGLSDKTTDKIQKLFVRNLSQQDYNGLITGVPTKASLREHRSSFIDTGLYSKSFRAWVTEVD